MKISVNKEPVETQSTQLMQLAQELSLPNKGVAVAVNNRMIPRAEWDKFQLTEGMEIIVIKAACGG